MISGKFLAGNKTLIIEDNKTYTFDMAGNFESCTDVLVNHKSGLQNFNFISVLSSNNNIDVLVANNGTCKMYKCGGDLQEVVMRIIALLKPLRILNKKGKVGEAGYAQSIFIFRADTNISNVVNILGLVAR